MTNVASKASSAIDVFKREEVFAQELAKTVKLKSINAICNPG